MKAFLSVFARAQHIAVTLPLFCHWFRSHMRNILCRPPKALSPRIQQASNVSELISCTNSTMAEKNAFPETQGRVILYTHTHTHSTLVPIALSTSECNARYECLAHETIWDDWMKCARTRDSVCGLQLLMLLSRLAKIYNSNRGFRPVVWPFKRVEYGVITPIIPSVTAFKW